MKLIDADKADVIAVGAMHAGDMRQPPPARTIILRHLLIDAFDLRRVVDDAAGVIAGDPGAGAGKACQHGAGCADTQRRGQRSNDQGFLIASYQASHLGQSGFFVAYVSICKRLRCTLGRRICDFGRQDRLRLHDHITGAVRVSELPPVFASPWTSRRSGRPLVGVPLRLADAARLALSHPGSQNSAASECPSISAAAATWRRCGDATGDEECLITP